MPYLGRVRQGWSEVGRSDDNGRECGVGRARGAAVSGGWECALGRIEEADAEEEEGAREGLVGKGWRCHKKNKNPTDRCREK